MPRRAEVTENKGNVQRIRVQMKDHAYRFGYFFDLIKEMRAAGWTVCRYSQIHNWIVAERTLK